MALQYELSVAGKRVTLKRRVPLKDGHDLPALYRRVREQGDMNRQVDIMRLMVDSWEFGGDPSDPHAWEELDLFDVIYPLWRMVDDHVGERIAYDPKATAPPSSGSSPSETPSTPRSSTR